MRTAVATFVVALVLTALLTPVARRVALAAGAIDEPGARRVHARHVPRLGGLAIVLGFFLPLLGLLALGAPAGRALFSATPAMRGFALGALLLVSVGLVDDIRGVGAKYKLIVQVAAATAAFSHGMRIEAVDLPWVGVLQLGWLAFPATVAWFVGIVNAVNLVDGLDGLAAGVVFFACLTNFVIASLGGNIPILFFTASLGGATVGFLFYNFNPARIFMGDTGSMFLGFALASGSLLGAGNQKTPTLVAIIVPILALGLPITDMLLTIARRFFAHRSIFVADREHIHHRLLDMGLTHRRAVLSLYVMSIGFTVLALVVYLGRSWQVGVSLFALSALLVGVVRFMGYFNSSLAAAGRATAEERAEPLRLSVPRVLHRMWDARSSDQLPAILAEFGEEAGLLAIGIVNANNRRLQRWRWESPRTEGRASRDAICTKFDISDGRDVLELQFLSDSAEGIVGPITRVLLRLVADGAEAVLATSAVRTEAVMVEHNAQVSLPGE
jgi:UDP-GlcNAc:undecaprenyl-phosphate GlcNAc-1-phosphate transferase